MADYSDLIRPNIRDVKPYIPGKPVEELRRELHIEGEIAKMASNENMLGPSPKAVEAIRKAAEGINYYPDNSCYYLSQAVADKYGVVPDMVHVTSGGVELLYNLAQVLLGPGDEAIMAKPTFMVYPILSKLFDCKSIEVEGKRFEHDLLKMADAITDKTKIIWVASPSNPAGTYNGADEVDAFIKKVNDRCLIVFDEAYTEFVDADDYPDTIKYLKEGRRICILRTLSKTLGLAGVRIGWGFADPELVKYLRTVRINFSVNSLAQAAALAALGDDEHHRRGYEHVKESREFFYRELDRLGIDYLPTQANFIFVNFKRDTRDICDALKHRGFLVRPGWVFGTPNHVRVSFAAMDTNKRFIEALETVLEEEAIDSAVKTRHYEPEEDLTMPPAKQKGTGTHPAPPSEPR
jgi:histidinol-phosphate aminotransferase